MYRWIRIRCYHPARKPLLAAIAGTLALALATQAAEPKKPAGEPPEAAIRASARAFIDAFDRGDAKAVAALFTDNATLVDDRGATFKGRKAIEAQYAAFFQANPGAKMEVAVKSVEFPSPATAVEDGVATVVVKHSAPPSAGKYTAVHILDHGKWLMASVRETALETPSNFARLAELGGLVGTWENKSEGVTICTTFQWIANKSFLAREYSVREDGVTTSSGLQLIGWDPQAGRIRSWSFDSSGGHGSGSWFATPEGWRIESQGVLADGTPVSSQDLLIRVAGEDRVFGWRSTDRRIGRRTMPDSREVVLDRVAEKR